MDRYVAFFVRTMAEGRVLDMEVDISMTPPRYTPDRVSYEFISTKGGRYKRRVKVSKFLQDMSDYISSQIRDFQVESITGTLGRECLTWKRREEERSSAHGIAPQQTSAVDLNALMYIKDTARVSDSVMHELHMLYPMLPGLGVIKAKRQEINNYLMIRDIAGVSLCEPHYI